MSDETPDTTHDPSTVCGGSPPHGGEDREEGGASTGGGPDGAKLPALWTGEEGRAGRERHDGWTEVKRQLFLMTLEETGNVRAACSMVRLSSTSAYRHRRASARFARDWDTALVRAKANVEAMAYERLVKGSKRVRMKDGKEMWTEYRQSDGLLALMLKARVLGTPIGGGSGNGGGSGGGSGGPVLSYDLQSEAQRGRRRAQGYMGWRRYAGELEEVGQDILRPQTADDDPALDWLDAAEAVEPAEAAAPMEREPVTRLGRHFGLNAPGRRTLHQPPCDEGGLVTVTVRLLPEQAEWYTSEEYRTMCKRGDVADWHRLDFGVRERAYVAKVRANIEVLERELGLSPED